MRTVDEKPTTYMTSVMDSMQKTHDRLQHFTTILQQNVGFLSTVCHCVAADGILNQEKVTNNLGLPNAIYMIDVFHLLDIILPKKLGNDCYNIISDHIKQMIYSKTKDCFDEGYKKAWEMLQSRH